ncbi:derlin-2 [Striga asiatica]|uniref:Derlin-2 n=1 Tax=Striga asiatica TaxID=4170 RepID=A0A5A7RJS6_STRAF|nr:derlin-2 [Striga asiatica]
MDDSAVRKKVRDSYIETRSGRRSSRRWSLGCGRDAVTTTRRRGMKERTRSIPYAITTIVEEKQNGPPSLEERGGRSDAWSRRISPRYDGRRRRSEHRRISDGGEENDRSFENRRRLAMCYDSFGGPSAVSVAYTWSRRIAWRCDGRRPELRRILDFWGRVVDERSFENWILVGLHLNLGWSVIDFLIECWAALRKIELGQEGKVVGLWADKGDDLALSQLQRVREATPTSDIRDEGEGRRRK